MVERIAPNIYAVCCAAPGSCSTSILNFDTNRIVTFAGSKGPSFVRRERLAFCGRGNEIVLKQVIADLPPSLYAGARRRIRRRRRASVRPMRRSTAKAVTRRKLVVA